MKTTTTTTTSNYNDSDRLKLLQEKLKALYKADNTIPSMIRLEEGASQQSIDDYYVNLQMVLKEDQANTFENSAKDTVGGEKEPISLSQMFDKVEGAEATSKVFVLGGPGVGKTTLLHNMSYKWANGLWQDKFDLVIRVRLKEMLNFSQSSHDAEDMLPDFIFECLRGQRNNLSRDVRKFEPFKCKEIRELLTSDQLKRTLLLVDGYDEIAGLKTSSNDKERSAYKEIIDYGILGFPNVVMTSRPSAVDDKLLGHFKRKIVNNGLDSEGVNQYIKNFFEADTERNKGNEASLKGFLNKHGSIQDMCKTPINVSLICMIWQEPEIQEELRENIESGSFKVGQLYENIVFKLTKRYGSEKLDDLKDARDIEYIKHITKPHVFELGITKAIKDIAYCHFVSGNKGLKPRDSDNKEEITSGGATGIKGDLLNDFIQEHYGNEKVNIGEVVKFGLLNAEGNSRNLTEQTMYFVHLTFKEYLTAYQMYESLRTNEGNGKSSENAKSAAEAIATNRNNPSYLMTLKFLAGIVSDSSDNVTILRFWQAVSCNVDGIIELGAHEKVKLFMHLLGQSKIGGTFDTKIPNLKAIKKFIDRNIEKQDLSYWQDEIITSGYLSEKIVKKVKKLISSASKAPQEKQQEIKAAFNLAQKLINDQQVQDSIGDKSQIFDIISGLLKVESLDWQMKKFFIKKLSELVEGIRDKKLCETGSQIIQFFQDGNLRETSTSCYVQLVKNILDKESVKAVLEQLLPLLQSTDWVVSNSAAKAIGRIAAGDKELGKEALEQLLPLVQSRYSGVPTAAAEAIGRIAAGDKELGKEALEQLLLLLMQSTGGVVTHSTAAAIEKIAALDKELAKATLGQLLLILLQRN